ncbi:hypothetical protein [Stackebrandtia nassauensis]|uniref:Uncharacterized protein n=1 Tax=Stackebrandtia nassauensis (strain DSM 44728 / CIP 108903 / NRRL B-16338 / NBRC 102104 / LLR-40K-21) TaxID=446470 RepID=D3PWF8_STANL|nr:hypothetical protein [Stackebrandtia nassauensis]ADD41315.1 hypothetical protein Snas_1612 [Stackebrandtia nassauensis DSM 44728]
MSEYHIDPPVTGGGGGQPSPQPQMPGYGYGGYQPQPMPPQGEQVVLTIGDIAVTPNSIIVPQGQFPLRGTTWTVQDSTQTTQGIPTWAIIMTIIGVWFCLIGLLFLLAKETRHTGFVSVSVSGPGLYHTVQLPPGPMRVAQVTAQVNQARSMAAVAQ